MFVCQSWRLSFISNVTIAHFVAEIDNMALRQTARCYWLYSGKKSSPHEKDSDIIKRLRSLENSSASCIEPYLVVLEENQEWIKILSIETGGALLGDA